MFSLKPENIEDYIILSLSKEAWSKPRLVEKVMEQFNVTKQAVYKAVRKLHKDEVIAVNGKNISLHLSWVIKLENFCEETLENYGSDRGHQEFLKLSDGEYLTYKFKSLLNLDIFWTHVFSSLLYTQKPNSNIFIFNPHQWFMLGRKEVEADLFQKTKERQIDWLQIISNDSLVDKQIIKQLSAANIKFSLTKQKYIDNRHYINVFGEFVVEAILGRKTTSLIEDVFKNSETIEGASQKMKEIISEIKDIHTLKVSRSEAKSKKIWKIFKKHFWLN